MEYDVSEIYISVGIWKNVVRKEYIDENVLFKKLNSHFLGGFVFFAALINLLLYFLIKERVYVFYAIMLLITCVGACSQLLSYGVFNEIPVAFYLFVCPCHIAVYCFYVLHIYSVSILRLVNSAVEITVKDNGTGIPDAIKDKILHPFFTTKPTGEGTGLSLSYDIVVKGHGGSITIDSKEGEITELTVGIK